MRYAENWIKVDIEHLELNKVLTWCANNLQGQQFIEEKIIKFEDAVEAAQFKLAFQEDMIV